MTTNSDPCKGCTERNVTPEYNCHSHCKEWIKARLKKELLRRKYMRDKEIKTTLMEGKEQTYKKRTGKRYRQP